MGIAMDLRHLRYFIAVAEEGHITRAAERLNIQQPPLSRLIKTIEREVDAQLFRRKPRGVELTEAGRAFLDRARAALANVNQAVVTARRTARGEQGRISVGVVPTAPFHPFVPQAIRAFREAFPLVSVTLDEAYSDLLVQGLKTERIDAAFIRSLPTDGEGLLLNRLLYEEFVVAISSEHPLALGKAGGDGALPLKVLADQPFIMLKTPGRFAIHAATIAACHAAGFTPKIAQEVPQIISAVGYVAAGFGIAFIPESMRRMQMHGVSYRRIAGPARPTLPLVLASRRGDPSPVLRQFLNLVKRAAKDFPAAPGKP
jgi:DNA-binding transcriptional LysR family regulator